MSFRLDYLDDITGIVISGAFWTINLGIYNPNLEIQMMIRVYNSQNDYDAGKKEINLFKWNMPSEDARFTPNFSRREIQKVSRDPFTDAQALLLSIDGTDLSIDIGNLPRLDYRGAVVIPDPDVPPARGGI